MSSLAPKGASYSARVNLLNGATSGQTKQELTALLAASFREDALDTLKLVAHIRDCRSGKGERELGRFALEYLADKHPTELVHNLNVFVGDYGRFDDVVALLNSRVETSALDLLATQLRADLAVLQQSDDEFTAAEGAAPRISMCAKWIPSQQSALDKTLQVNKKLSRHMKLSPATLRKVYLSPLREKLQILERFMCAREWDAIDLNVVPSVAMQFHTKPRHAFERHLGEKLTTWKAGRVRREADVHTQRRLFPHQIVARYLKRERDDPKVDAYLEAHWTMAMDEVSRTGSLDKTLVLSDVSRSMMGRPLETAIALGLMVSSVAPDAYKHRVLTFESAPRFHTVVGDTLGARVRSLSRAPCANSMSFIEAFRAVLRVAREVNLPKEQMPARLIAVSDLPFTCVNCTFEATYVELQQEFEDAGYAVSHLVYWDVRSEATSAQAYKGNAKVSLATGFSIATFKRVVAGKPTTPLQTLMDVVHDARYDAITLPRVSTTQTDKRRPNVVL